MKSLIKLEIKYLKQQHLNPYYLDDTNESKKIKNSLSRLINVATDMLIDLIDYKSEFSMDNDFNIAGVSTRDLAKRYESLKESELMRYLQVLGVLGFIRMEKRRDVDGAYEQIFLTLDPEYEELLS